MLNRVRANGVVGAGGAGFPTYKKLERPVDTVILNAAECEPLLHKDKEVLRHHLDEVLAGFTLAARQVGATRAVIGIKEKYEDLIADLERHGADVHRLGDYYPAGDEFITVFEVTGRIIPPGGLPGDVGCLVINVETALNLGLDRPVTHKFLSVAGDVPEPCTVRAPVGASYRDVLRAVGVDTDRVGDVLVGGVMMGRLMGSLDEVVTRTTGALFCFPHDHGLPRRYKTDSRARDLIGKSACDQCSFCTELCPRYLIGKSACDQCSFCTELCPRYLIGHPVEPHMAMRGLGFNLVGDSMVAGSQFCCECNLCSLYACPEDLFPKDACADNKHEMRARGVQHPATGSTDVRAHSMQEYRHVPVSSLIKKLGLSQFRNVGPLVDVAWRLDEVRVPLKQHVGAPAVATVRAGQRVEEGAEIGAVPDGLASDVLGVAIHASMSGTVASVGDEITIRRSR